jgi:uncharacterized protein with PIN domain
MLGKLTRWLRILGQDVTYYRSEDDQKLLDLAKSNKRILLTRDHKLVKQAINNGVKVSYVEKNDKVDIISDLAKLFGFNLQIDLNVSRCPKCNELLRSVLKNAVLEEIPELTAIHNDTFWKCMRCGKVYWHGAHWKGIIETLEKAKRKLGNH